jgi:hypothetical protein
MSPITQGRGTTAVSATAAVDVSTRVAGTLGAAAAVLVDTEDGSGEGGVPEETAWPRAGDDSATAARTPIRKLFTNGQYTK